MNKSIDQKEWEILYHALSAGLWGAQVVVSLDFNLPGEKLPPMGLIVDAQGVIEQWDLDSIRKRVGGDFYRRPGQILRFKPK